MTEENLYDSIQALWSWLAEAPTSRAHSFRTPTLITCAQNIPTARTMVLRDVFDEKLIFFTDRRSYKQVQIKSNNNAIIHSYDASRRRQIRLQSTIEIVSHHNKMKQWREQGLARFLDYGSFLAPGAEMTADNPIPQLNIARQNFSVLCAHILSIEILQLTADKHKRILWKKVAGEWQKRALVP